MKCHLHPLYRGVHKPVSKAKGCTCAAVFAGAKALRDHRFKLGASGILLVSGHVLLGLRSPDDDALPNLWCTPGGGVEIGESIDSAIRREFAEEAGLHVAVSPLSRTFVGQRLNPEKNHTTILVFKQVQNLVMSSEPSARDGFSEVRWFGPREALRCKDEITPLTYAALQDFLFVPVDA